MTDIDPGDLMANHQADLEAQRASAAELATPAPDEPSPMDPARAQDIRRDALKAALAADPDGSTLIERAKDYEDYILNGA
jgi:hypothetical protein